MSYFKTPISNVIKSKIMRNSHLMKLKRKSYKNKVIHSFILYTMTFKLDFCVMKGYTSAKNNKGFDHKYNNL